MVGKKEIESLRRMVDNITASSPEAEAKVAERRAEVDAFMREPVKLTGKKATLEDLERLLGRDIGNPVPRVMPE